MTEVVRIALDAMGGDHAPSEVVKGALLAAAEFSVEIILVGQEEVVRRELAAAGATS
jgi:glycerol-3-phosphate acyltransferase PlsX